MIEQAFSSVAHAVGHPAMLPVCAVLIVTLYLWLGIDAANFAISVCTLALLPIMQNSQNRDGLAIQVKLDELIRSSAARNELIGLDTRTEKEIEHERLPR